ncbi:hypothetical protein [Tissierella sp.]|uniref:hypothetical protein n=1 Tax=Tissierella sp. TaxID=41274 RepID=UPI0028AE56A5|nr:hypothetical protein [Tissierella sp.]
MNKMTMKEAGRYANFLDRTIEELIYLSNYGMDSKIYSITEIHKKSASYKDALDETIEVEFEDDTEIDIPQLTLLLEDLFFEKAMLAESISEAKKSLKIKIDETRNMNLDSALEYAKLLRRFSEAYLRPLTNRKDKKTKEKRTGYAFNVEGNQTPYIYETEVITTVIYNTVPLSKKIKTNNYLADRISEGIDMAMNLESVEFSPKFSYLDSCEDIINQYKKDF